MRTALVVLVGVLGTLATAGSVWRLLSALRSKGTHDLVVGWLAITIACTAATFLALRVL